MAGEYIEFNNSTQPAVNDTNLNRLQQLIKQDISGAVSGDTLPIGAIMPFGSNTIPENWLLCDGSAVSRTTYQYLFNTIGTTYGSGDGFTTFNLPDLRGKVVVGLDSNDASFDVLGETGGEKTHTLTIAEMPSHRHDLTYVKSLQLPLDESGVSGFNSNNTGAVTKIDATQAKGGGQAHNILQPYIVQNYIIKANQSSGVLATVVDNLNSTSSTDALSANQGKVLKELLEGTVLYESETGLNQTTPIPLTYTVSNYKRIKIYYKNDADNNQIWNTAELFDAVGKKCTLETTRQGSVNQYKHTAEITVAENQINWGYYAQFTINGNGISDYFVNYQGLIRIYKVVGYKY